MTRDDRAYPPVRGYALSWHVGPAGKSGPTFGQVEGRADRYGPRPVGSFASRPLVPAGPVRTSIETGQQRERFAEHRHNAAGTLAPRAQPAWRCSYHSLRSSSLNPPHTPYGSFTVSAWARHSS